MESADSDAFGIPARLFGPLSDALPSLIGRIVMLAALLESRVSDLTSCLGSGPQSYYDDQSAKSNLQEIRRLAPRYKDSESETKFGRRLLTVATTLTATFRARNDIVHRVWTHAGVGQWAGWKPDRARTRAAEPQWTAFESFNSDDLENLVLSMVELLSELDDLIAEAGGYTRRD